MDSNIKPKYKPRIRPFADGFTCSGRGKETFGYTAEDAYNNWLEKIEQHSKFVESLIG